MNRINDDDLPVDRAYALAKYDQIVREFVLQLKLGELDLEYFQRKFDVNARRLFAEPLQQMAAHGRLQFDGHQIKLSTSGLVQIDRLIPAFYPLAHQRVGYW